MVVVVEERHAVALQRLQCSRRRALAELEMGPRRARTAWYSEGGEHWELPDGGLFWLAAVTAPREVDDDGPRLSYALVTRAAVEKASKVVTSRGDSRMPLVLPAELHDAWLDQERPADADLVALVQAGSEDLARAMRTGAAPALF